MGEAVAAAVGAVAVAGGGRRTLTGRCATGGSTPCDGGPGALQPCWQVRHPRGPSGGPAGREGVLVLVGLHLMVLLLLGCDRCDTAVLQSTHAQDWWSGVQLLMLVTLQGSGACDAQAAPCLAAHTDCCARACGFACACSRRLVVLRLQRQQREPVVGLQCSCLPGLCSHGNERHDG